MQLLCRHVALGCRLVVAMLMCVVVVVVGVAVPQRAFAAAVTEFGYRFPSAASDNDVSPGPTGIVAGPDGAMWWSDHGHIGRITTDGQVRLFSDRRSGEDLLDSPVVGPDGQVWLIDAPAGRIGRISMTGEMRWFRMLEVTVPGFPIPVVVEPQSLALGPDGAIWYTDRNANVIGRITADGAARFFPLRYEVNEIAAGPDGALWFTTYLRRRIGRITTTGDVAYFSSGLTGEPWDIVAGPDGNLWFTEAFSEPGGVGRITPSGDIVEYKGPATKDAIKLAVGPDQALWFATHDKCPSPPATINACALGRITADGKATVYRGSILTNAGIHGIAAGPDGNLWFAEGTAGKIGRLDLDACGGATRHVLRLRDRWPRLITAKAWLDGELIHIAKRTLRVTVDLGLHPAGTARVKVTGRTRAGRHVTMRRSYRIACAGS